MAAHDSGVDAFLHEFETRHRERLAEASREGEASGKRNLPALDAPSDPFEERTRAAYDGELSSLGCRCQPHEQQLVQRKREIERQREGLKQDPDFITREIARAEAERKRRLDESETNHLDELKNIENEPSWLLEKRAHEREEARFLAVALHEGRQEKQSVIAAVPYGLLLGFVGICEIPINYQVFVGFREMPLLTLIMAGVLVVSLPFLSHSSGVFLRRFREKREYLWFLAVAVILVATLSYYTARLRQQYLGTKPGMIPEQLATDLWTFFIISLILYFVGSMAGYLAHDPSSEFTEVHDAWKKSKATFAKACRGKHERENSERARFEAAKRSIQDEFTQRKHELNARQDELERASALIEGELEHLREAVRGAKQRIDKAYREVIQAYRHANLTFRNNHAQPRFWDAPLRSLTDGEQ